MAEELKIGSEIDWVNMPREEAILLAMKLFNFDRAYAGFYVSLAKGEIKGDVIDADTATEKEKEIFGL